MERNKSRRESYSGKHGCCGSLPNLNIARSAKEVGREVEETSLEFMNVDYHLAGCFKHVPEISRKRGDEQNSTKEKK